MTGINGSIPDDISKRLLAAKVGELWAPHPIIRRIHNLKGEERVQQLWCSNAGNMDWRDVPLFNQQGEYINEGDSAINTGPLTGETKPDTGPQV